MSKIVSVL